MPRGSERICLGPKLNLSKSVRCLPLRLDLSEYSRKELDLILFSRKVYFPTPHYVELFSCLKKEMFPSRESYGLLGNKIKQTLLFKALELPHPETRIFHGRVKIDRILEVFDYPFVAKVPVGLSRGLGTFLIRNEKDLNDYMERTSRCYFQEYVETDRDIRVVIMGKEVILSFWKIQEGTDFRTNVYQGGKIDVSGVPQEAVKLAKRFCTLSNIDHAGIDIIMSERGPLLLEANIHFGREGFRKKGIDYKQVLKELADSHKI